MATSTTDQTFLGGAATPIRAAGVVGVRDPRLDFYRGIAMFIILAAHTPSNFWASWIPGRWGFSDATEIFVFCSGMASSIAFGGSFARRGWLLGTARVAQRVWQIYWAHVALFFATATLLAAVDQLGGFDKHYIGSLNLWKFFEEPGPLLVGFFSLTYVPNYFDILPMYMVILAMMPVAMALARVHAGLVFAASIALWLAAQSALFEWLGMPGGALAFPAEPWSDREWFFNPFAWQIVFFTGFAFRQGWIATPPVAPWLVLVAWTVVLANVAVSNVAIRELGWDWARDWRVAHAGWISKTDQGLLRYAQFLALAYLAWVAAGTDGARLRPQGDGAGARARAGLVAVISRVGQQSLAIFLFSMFLARLSGVVMDQIGRTTWNMTLANLAGFALLVVVAYAVSWFKRQPWRTSGTG